MKGHGWKPGHCCHHYLPTVLICPPHPTNLHLIYYKVQETGRILPKQPGVKRKQKYKYSIGFVFLCSKKRPSTVYEQIFFHKSTSTCTLKVVSMHLAWSNYLKQFCCCKGQSHEIVHLLFFFHQTPHSAPLLDTYRKNFSFRFSQAIWIRNLGRHIPHWFFMGTVQFSQKDLSRKHERAVKNVKNVRVLSSAILDWNNPLRCS